MKRVVAQKKTWLKKEGDHICEGRGPVGKGGQSQSSFEEGFG